MKNIKQKIRIGSRGSKLALTQVEMVQAALSVVAPDVETEVVIIKTSGDWLPEHGETRLSTENGGKGQFATEIEAALLAGEIDCAVHSMKDMETKQPDGLVIPYMLPREDVRDVLLVSDTLRGKVKSLDDLPQGATVGTASVRRQAFLLNKRPDLKCVPIRGNVGTRIEKVRAGQIEAAVPDQDDQKKDDQAEDKKMQKIDATFLAIAGLKRLDLDHEVDVILETENILPAAGQGAVGIEFRAHDSDFLAIFSQLNCKNTLFCVSAERAALAVLDGSCHTPIGAYAERKDGEMHLRLCVASLDGKNIFTDQASSSIQDLEQAKELGASLAAKLKASIPDGLLNQVA